MKFIIYLLSLTLLLLPACKTRDKGKEKPEKKVEEADREKPAEPEISFQEFESEKYDFDFKYPADWTYESFSPTGDQFILNFFEKEKKNKLDLPILVHTNADNSFIGFYPEGYGTELPVGKSRPLNEDEIEWISFTLNRDKSEVFTLENGQVWAFFLVPSSPPPGWDEYGFIFAQSAIQDFKMVCLDGETGEEKSTQDCDPMMGDEIKIFGNIPDEMSNQMERVIGSIKFKNESSSSETDNYQSSRNIEVTNPKPGSVIFSPLPITGRARGPWYFEGIFNIKLVKDGKILAETEAEAQEKWMTEDYVPFKAILNFKDFESGENAILVFTNNNPSGKKENEKRWDIKVKAK